MPGRKRERGWGPGPTPVPAPGRAEAGARRLASSRHHHLVDSSPSPCPRPSTTLRGCPHADGELIRVRRRGLLRSVTDTCVRLWRRVHMDLLRYAGCVCRPSF
ncbi:putative leader peptide [Streptomyces sp. P9-A2]|uniref:putative leader peptide n=1 Tax=Streptomyces sp. P9-A2 TaxID=3072284 RepID=UPI003FCDC44A